MPSATELKKRLRVLRSALREAEEEMLTERRKERDLAQAYSQTSAVRPGTLPLSMRNGSQ